MAAADSHQANGFSAPSSAHACSRYIPRQPSNLALENAWVPPTPVNNQREDIPQPDRADLHHIDVAYQDIVDYHPQPLANPTYVGQAQGIPVQVQPNAPVNQEHNNPFGYVPPDVAPGLVQAAFPHPLAHRTPTPAPPPQAGVENLRQLASNYLHHPDAKVSMVTMEAGAAGRIKVAVIFETPDF